MLARRLLMVGGGGGSFTAPPAAFSLGVTGFWSNVSEPVAAHYNGKTYFCWVDDAADVKVAEYNHATETVSTPVTLVNTSAPDGVIHNSPAILVRSSDRKILVTMAAEHGNIVYWLSTNAEDASAFGSQTSVASGTYDYTSLAQLNGLANDPIYLFTTGNAAATKDFRYIRSTDGGATWDAPVSILDPVSTSGLYFRVVDDGDQWVHLFLTTTDRVDAPSSVYHFKFDGTALYQSDGTLIGSSFPYSVDDGTLVQDASLGTARPEGCVLDESGNPTVAVLCFDTDENSDLVRVARWTGSEWSVNSVGSMNGLHTFKFNEGVAFTDPNTAFVPRIVGSDFELHRAVTSDGWVTYTETQVTSSSGADNLEPFAVRDGAAELLVVWGRGTLTSGSDFDFTIYGYGT